MKSKESKQDNNSCHPVGMINPLHAPVAGPLTSVSNDLVHLPALRLSSGLALLNPVSDRTGRML
jgi:hypothetical protein